MRECTVAIVEWLVTAPLTAVAMVLAAIVLVPPILWILIDDRRAA